MSRSGTQGFEFKFGKIWNFNLSNFYTVITRHGPLKFCQSVRGLNTRPGSRSSVRGRRTPHTVRGRHTLDRGRRTGDALASRSDYMAECTKNYCKVCAICHYTSIAHYAILYTSSRAKNTAGDPRREKRTKWKILPFSRL